MSPTTQQPFEPGRPDKFDRHEAARPRPRVVAVIGLPGSGKSTLTAFLRAQDIPVVCTAELRHAAGIQRRRYSPGDLALGRDFQDLSLAHAVREGISPFGVESCCCSGRERQARLYRHLGDADFVVVQCTCSDAELERRILNRPPARRGEIQEVRDLVTVAQYRAEANPIESDPEVLRGDVGGILYDTEVQRVTVISRGRPSSAALVARLLVWLPLSLAKTDGGSGRPIEHATQRDERTQLEDLLRRYADGKWNA